VQGYNAQAPSTTTNRLGGGDRQHSSPDAQYGPEQHMDEVIANAHIQVLVRPDSSGRTAAAAGLDQRAVLVDANRPRVRARQGAVSKWMQMIEARVRSRPNASG